VTLMDLRLPDMSGVDALVTIRAEFPNARIAMLTTFDGDAEIRRALEAGAQGYLLKSMPRLELVGAIRTVAEGRRYVPKDVATQLAQYLGQETLSRREIEVL